MRSTTWILWIALALTAGGASSILARNLRLRPWQVLASAIFGATVGVAALYLIRVGVDPRPVEVSITAPRTGEPMTSSRIRVTGKARPAGSRVTVVVRSEKDLRWWVQEVVSPDSEGSWSLDAYLGTPRLGAGETFHIIALASADSALFNLLTDRRLAPGETLPVLPQWNWSSPVVVRRTS